MMEQGPLAHRTDARDLVEQGMADAAGALRAMGANGEAMGLVAQPLDEPEHRIAFVRHQRVTPGKEDALASGIAVRTLGDTGDFDTGYAEILDDGKCRRQLSGAAVDEDKIGPGGGGAFRVLLDEAREAAHENLAHHRIVVACRGRADRELAILVLHESVGAGNDHRADGLGSLDMTVVVDLDAPGRRVEAEQGRQTLKMGALCRTLGEAPLQGIPRVLQGMVHQGPAATPARDADLHTVSPPAGEGLGQECVIVRPHRHQDDAGDFLVLVELGQEGCHHAFRIPVGATSGPVGPVAVVASVTDEEDLDAGLPAFPVQRHDIGRGQRRHVDLLVRLDVVESANAVAQAGSALELKGFGSVLHAPGETVLDLPGLALEKGAGLSRQVLVVLVVGKPDTGRHAALDLVLQAGPGAVAQHVITAASERKRLLQGRDGPVDRTGAGKGTEVVALPAPRPAMLDDLRPPVVATQQDVGEGLVVSQDDVVARLELLDEVGFEKQCLGFRCGGDHFDGRGAGDHPVEARVETPRLRVGCNPVCQVARLADIENLAFGGEHAVDTGPFRHGGQRSPDGVGAALCGDHVNLFDRRSLGLP